MNTEQQIEFDKVKEMWSLLAVTAYAKERIAEATVILEERELRMQKELEMHAKKRNARLFLFFGSIFEIAETLGVILLLFIFF